MYLPQGSLNWNNLILLNTHFKDNILHSAPLRLYYLYSSSFWTILLKCTWSLIHCNVWWHSFRPQIHDESETDQILNAKYFVWKNYTLGKWGLREAFNQNSLMQLFNGDRHIVHCISFKMDSWQSFKNSLRNDDCHFPVASTRNTPHHFQKLRFSWNCIKPDQLQTLDWVL